MYERLLTFLRCPQCEGELELQPLAWDSTDDAEISEGLLYCRHDHVFPIARGIPRMLPDALGQHRASLERSCTSSEGRVLLDHLAGDYRPDAAYDRRTRQNFSFEWQNYELGDRTWGMHLDDRVRGFFLEPIRMPVEELDGRVVLDAGCGNGTQSVAYTEFGLEVVALDLSSGLETGQAYRRLHPGARADRVHFVEADLQSPPLAPATFDIIHSAGVLHHTSCTERSFRRLCPLMRPNGTFYVWVYAYEPVVTPLVNTLRLLTTRVPPAIFARAAYVLADAFRLFTWAADRLGIRAYGRLTRREAALALTDIFGAPYAHYHTFAEVASWFHDEGFDEVWGCNHSRRGFGVCGRGPADARVEVTTDAVPGLLA